MNDDSNNITRRDWLKRVAATAVAGSMVGAFSSCRRENDDWLSMRANGTSAENNRLNAADVAASLPSEIDCLSCGRCMPCNFGVNIPAMISAYNNALRKKEIPSNGNELLDANGFGGSRRFVKRIEREIGDKHIAHRCSGCHRCEQRCPQELPIADIMRNIGRLIDLTRELE